MSQDIKDKYYIIWNKDTSDVVGITETADHTWINSLFGYEIDKLQGITIRQNEIIFIINIPGEDNSEPYECASLRYISHEDAFKSALANFGWMFVFTVEK